MQQIINVLIVIAFIVLGGIPSLYIFFCIPTIIIWKIYRRIRYKIPIMK